MATRGLSYSKGRANQKKIEYVVSPYSEDLNANPQSGFALLFYHFENDTLYRWLFNHNTLEASAIIPLKGDSLIAMVNTLNFSLSVDEKINASRSVLRMKIKNIGCAPIKE